MSNFTFSTTDIPGVQMHDKFAHMLLDFYGDPAQYACEMVKQP